MSRPDNLKTKIFLDGGNPEETREVMNLLGFLDGQTTNPTLVAQNPAVRTHLEKGVKFNKSELVGLYRDIVREISSLIPDGSVSVEVYADRKTTAYEMLTQAHEMYSWISNAHIKLPAVAEGLWAAARAVQENIRVNITLVFSQEQAAAIYGATKGAPKGSVFVSPFVGRLDDQGTNGIQLIENIIKMYAAGDGHIEVLTASVRNLEHLLKAIEFGSDSITAPAPLLKKWAAEGMPLTDGKYAYASSHKLKELPYRKLDLTAPWQQHNLYHELTEQGVDRFTGDWNALLG
jgi:transaldolase